MSSKPVFWPEALPFVSQEQHKPSNQQGSLVELGGSGATSQPTVTTHQHLDPMDVSKDVHDHYKHTLIIS